MTQDPFDVLGSPDPHAVPDPAFVARLESRLVELEEVLRADRPSTAPIGTRDGIARDQEDIVMELGPLTARPGRRRAWLVAGPVAAVALTAALVAVTVSDRDDGPVGPPPTSARSTAPTAATPATTVPVSTLPPVQSFDEAGATLFPLQRDSVLKPTYLTVAGTSVWVQWDLRTGDRLDRATGERIGDLPVVTDGVAISRPLAAFGSVWVTERDGTVVRVDAETGAVTATIALPKVEGATFWFPVDLVAAPDGVWTVTLGGEQRLVRIDAASNQVTANLPAPDGARATLGSGDVASIAYGDGSLWVALRSSVLVRLDPTTGVELERVDLPVVPAFLAATPGALWVSGNGEGRVAALARVDVATHRVTGVVPTSELPLSPLIPLDLAVGGGYAWVATADAQLVQVDQVSLTVVARYGRPDGSGGNVVVVDDEVWGVIASSAAPTVYRMPVRRVG